MCGIMVCLATLAQAPGGGGQPPPAPPTGSVVCVVDSWWANADGSIELHGRIYWQAHTVAWRHFTVSLENCGTCPGHDEEDNAPVNEWDCGEWIGWNSGMIWWSFVTHPDDSAPMHCDWGQQLITNLWWVDTPRLEPHYGVAGDFDIVRFQ